MWADLMLTFEDCPAQVKLSLDRDDRGLSCDHSECGILKQTLRTQVICEFWMRVPVRSWYSFQIALGSQGYQTTILRTYISCSSMNHTTSSRPKTPWLLPELRMDPEPCDAVWKKRTLPWIDLFIYSVLAHDSDNTVLSPPFGLATWNVVGTHLCQYMVAQFDTRTQALREVTKASGSYIKRSQSVINISFLSLSWSEQRWKLRYP